MLFTIPTPPNSTPTYWYEGICPDTGKLLQLPRTQGAEEIALLLMMSELARDSQFDCEGKMYGVLLVKNAVDDYFYLKAFSGFLNGKSIVDGWVPPLPGRDRICELEIATLADLEAMKQELIALGSLSEREEYRSLAAEFTERLAALTIEHRDGKLARQQQRQILATTLVGAELVTALHQLEENSRQDKRERRQLKQERDAILQPLQRLIDKADDRIRELKQQRKIRSRQLQTQMHEAYRLMNFLGTSSSLRELMPQGMPTGTGDCCAPKLLHYAATQGLQPIAMAEFWWGGGEFESEGRQWGEFYGACAQRCQPLMGFMLAGMDVVGTQNWRDRAIIYEDEWIIAIDKPAGLLSVPGRTIDLQDSVLTRLQKIYPELYPIHRLDRDTSGLLLLARDRQTYRQLSRQFHDRQIRKVYEAILGGIIDLDRGTIDLPLSGDPLDRPRQKVDFSFGKPSLTEFKVLEKTVDSAKPTLCERTRIEFYPHTGRTHQLRVHSAADRGLGIAILGDRLYGCQATVNRLHLHAREISFIHPMRSVLIDVKTSCPF